jgi:ribulose-phosphate 3-epimerase
MSVIISPSLLSADFLDLRKEIERLNSIDDLWLHLDIMDSHFVPNLTFGEPVLNKLQTITKHKLDAHFMVTNPEFFADSFKKVGLHNFTFHWEAILQWEFPLTPLLLSLLCRITFGVKLISFFL